MKVAPLPIIISNFVQNFSQKLADIADKLTAVYGELKAAVQKKVSETFNEIKKNLKNLSDEDKQVLKLSALMHDFGKKGNVPTKGHASISKKYAESVLENINVKDSVKERVIRHIDNHHWFQSYNQGFLEKDNVINIFPEEGDAAIAKILTKSDFESVKPNFHLRFLIPNRLLTQKEFDFEFDKMMSEIF